MLVRERLRLHGPEDLAAVEAVPIGERLGHDNSYDMFAAAAEAFPDNVAIRFLPTGGSDDTPVDITYREFIGRIRQTANLFHARGIGPGKVVAYLLPNLPETFYCLWGGEAAGIVCAINHFLEADHIGALLHHAKAEVLVLEGPSDFPIWEKLPRLRELAPNLKAIYRVGPGPEVEGVEDFHAAIAEQPDDRLVSGRTPKPDEIAAYFHTGGTTGVPKITPLSHRNETVMAWCSVQVFGHCETDVVYCGMPLFHAGGIKAGGMFAHATGATVLLAGPAGFRNRRTVEEFWRAVEHFGVTYVPGPPTVYGALADRPVDADISTLDMVQVSAAPSPRDLFARFRAATGKSLREAYGLTEATLVTNINPRGAEPRDGSAGFRLPYMEQRIVELDPDDRAVRDCGPNEIGVVAVRGPCVFGGYLPPASNDGLWLGDGWLNSGDMGRLDEDGYLWLTGRQKDMIIRSGHNIDPETIEGPFYTHPAVAQCAAVGKPDPYAGELPMAFVALAEGATADADELLAHAAASISERAAIPKQVVLMEALPLTAVGKIAKNLLRDEAARLAIQEAVDAEATLAGPLAGPLAGYVDVTVRRDPTEGTVVVATLAADAGPEVRDTLKRLLERYVVPSEIVPSAE